MPAVDMSMSLGSNASFELMKPVVITEPPSPADSEVEIETTQSSNSQSSRCNQYSHNPYAVGPEPAAQPVPLWDTFQSHNTTLASARSTPPNTTLYSTHSTHSTPSIPPYTPAPMGTSPSTTFTAPSSPIPFYPDPVSIPSPTHSAPMPISPMHTLPSPMPIPSVPISVPAPQPIQGKQDTAPTPSSVVVVVQFRFGRTAEFLHCESIVSGTYVVVAGDRGEDMGFVTHCRSATNADTGKNLPSVHRVASRQEVDHWHGHLLEEEKEAVKLGQEILDRNGIAIKIVHAEFQYDMKKLTFHYLSRDTSSTPRFKPVLGECYAVWKCRIWFAQCNRSCSIENARPVPTAPPAPPAPVISAPVISAPVVSAPVTQPMDHQPSHHHHHHYYTVIHHPAPAPAPQPSQSI